jgi:hypothetical protein
VITAWPFLLFVAALTGVYLRDGWIRVLGTIGLLIATAWSLGFLTDAATGAAWGAGPAVATLLVSRGVGAGRLTFEALTRRAVTLAATLTAAIFAAAKFPVGENPTLLSAVPWILAAVGAAFMISPLDRREHTQGLILLVGAGGALLLAAAPVGPLTAVACGLMAIAPVVAARWSLTGRVQTVAAGILVAASAALVAIALTNGPLGRPSLEDLGISLQGLVLPAVALLLAAGAVIAPRGRPWAALLGVVGLIAVAPSLRWAALAALVAVSIDGEGREERVAWLALLLLGVAALFAGLGGQPWSARAQSVGLAAALIVMAMASQRRMLRSLVLPATAVAIMQNVATLTAPSLARFQWVAAAGAVLLVGRALLARPGQPATAEWMADHLALGLLFLAVSARDPLGLGLLAAVLLLVDLAIVRSAPAPAVLTTPDPRGGLLALARSAWPPSVRFAAMTLTVAAALQATVGMGLLAAALVVGVQLAPLLDRAPLATEAPLPRTLRTWLAPALSLACGIAPALILRMLRV